MNARTQSLRPRKRAARRAGKPLAPPPALPRLVMVPGLETATGGPVLALASGTARRPVLALVGVTLAALAAREGRA